MLHADDLDGTIGDLARDLLELHAQVCDEVVVDPMKLAKWMLRFSLDDQDFFELDPVRYAGALGELGLAAYRREVRQRLDSGDDSFGVGYAQERLAVLDRDVSEIVRLLGGDLRNPDQFIRVAEEWRSRSRRGRGRLGTSGDRGDDRLASGSSLRPCLEAYARKDATDEITRCAAANIGGCRRRARTSCCATQRKRAAHGGQSASWHAPRRIRWPGGRAAGGR